MNNTFSKALFIENLKRYWVIILAIFLVMFLGGPFLMISRYEYQYSEYFIRNILGSDNFTVMCFSLFMPVIAANCVFRYLNKTGSCSVIHAMPFSRKSLFVTNYVSGLAIMYIPLVLQVLCYIALKKPVMVNDVNVYAFSLIASYMFTVAVTLLFIYSLSVLAYMISGNSVIAVLTSYGLNFVLPAIYGLLILFAETFLYGYAYNSEFEVYVSKLNPYLLVILKELLGSDLTYSLLVWLTYIVVALLIAFAAYQVYKIRPLEKAGESYIFPVVQKIIAFLLTFAFSGICGLIFLDGYVDNPIGYVAFFIGAAVSFVIAQMIVLKSVKIANKESLVSFGVILGLIALTVCSFRFDLFGYAKRQPLLSNIESATIDTITFTSYDQTSNKTVYESESIGYVYDAQAYIVENYRKANLREYDNYYMYDDASLGYQENYLYNINISYDLKNGKTYNRSYDVPASFFNNCTAFAKWYDCDEKLAQADSIKSIKTEDTSVYFNYQYGQFGKDTSIYLNKDMDSKDFKEMLNCISEDLKDMTLEDSLNAGISLGRIEYAFNDEKGMEEIWNRVTGYEYCYDRDEEYGLPSEYNFTFYILPNMTRTIKWLEKHDIDIINSNTLDDTFMFIMSEEEFETFSCEDYEYVPKSGRYTVVSDKKELRNLLMNHLTGNARFLEEKGKIAVVYYNYGGDSHPIYSYNDMYYIK